MKDYDTSLGCDAGGTYILWYRDDDGNSGRGENAEIQPYYYRSFDPPDVEPDPSRWVALSEGDGPDRTDPGYWRDNY